jgi:hypothetical protein
MDELELVFKINECTTLKELDALRYKCITVGKRNPETFKIIQTEFVKKKVELQELSFKKYRNRY